MRDHLRFLALGLFASACAVGSATVEDRLTPDIGPGPGADASADGASTLPGLDGSPTADTGNGADGAGSRTSEDASGTPDPAPPDAAPDTGAPDSAGGCPAFTGALATFDLSSQPGNETSASATATATGVTAGPLTRGGALTAATGSGSINSAGWPAAIDATRFYTFSVTPPAGCTLRLSTLALDVKASANGPSSVDVATSVDAYASHKTASASSSGTITLSASSGGTLTVRIFGYGATSSGGTLRIQNTLTLSGTLN